MGQKLSSLTALKSLANKNNGDVSQIRILINKQFRLLPRNYPLWLKRTNVPAL
jgi:hypothetical protein